MCISCNIVYYTSITYKIES